MSLVVLRGTLRARLLAGTLIWIAASIVLAGAGLDYLFRAHVTRQFSAELTRQLDQLLALVAVDAEGQPEVRVLPSDPRFDKPYSGYYWQIERVDGTTDVRSKDRETLRSRSLWDFRLKVAAESSRAGEVQTHHVQGPNGEEVTLLERQVALADSGPALRLMVAAEARYLLEPIRQFRSALWISLALLAGGLVVAALIQVQLGMAPLRALRLGLADIRSGRTQRLEGRFPREIAPLVDEFNSVLAQNAQMVARAKSQAGNLAHALKTPLSVLAIAAGGDAGSARELAQVVGEQVELARRQVDYHLARARAAAASGRTGARADVQPVLEGLLRTLPRLYADKSVVGAIDVIDPDLVFRGESDDLQEMLGNLIDNAFKWARRSVRVGARRDGGCIQFVVEDDGPGVEAGKRNKVLQRGVRADEQVPGSGLGLSIVDDLARLYGGEIELSESVLGGLRVVLKLPAAER